MFTIGGHLTCREHELDANDITDDDLKDSHKGTHYTKVTEEMIKPSTLRRVGSFDKSFTYVEYDKTRRGYYAQ